jgi:replicative DNA helicase
VKEIKKNKPIEAVATEANKYTSEYERGLLSLVIRNIDLLTDLQQKITADHFLYTPHKLIYTALCSLITNPTVKTIDLESLIIESNKLGYSSLGVNAEYIAILAQGGFDKENYEFFYKKINDAYIKFKLYNVAQHFVTLIDKNASDSDKHLTSDGLLSKINEEMSAITAFKGEEAAGVEFGKIARDFVIKRAGNPVEVRGLRTGFPSLDNSLNGLMPGTLTIIAGIAKAGKSTVLANIADHVAIEAGIEAKEKGEPDPTVPVLFLSTEMSDEEDLARFIAIRTGEEERAISNGTAYNDPLLKKKIDKALEQLENSKIYHEYIPDFDAVKVCNLIYHYKVKYNIGLAIFDYIKLDTVSNSDKREDQILGDLTTALKNTAGKLKIPTVAACQINSRTRRVADSDRLERYCNSLVEFWPKTLEELEQQDFKKHGTHWLNVKRNRSGSNAKIPIRFFKKSLNLQEAEPFQSEEVEDDTTRALLTTPSEFERLKEEEFRVQSVTDVLDQKDAKDLEVFVGDDDDDNI